MKTEIFYETNKSGWATDERGRKFRPPSVWRNCKACSKEFRTKQSEAQTGGGKFCSRKCAQGGEHNPSWKGGVSKDNMRYKRRTEAKYPERTKARLMVMNAIRGGDLVRGPCETCGSTEKTHGHHDDYTKPLKVRWLCRRCHVAVHQLMRKKRRARA